MRSTSEPLRGVDHDLGKPCSVALDPSGSEYAYQLLDVIEENLGVIDQRVESLSENWRLSRMPVIDRNILRIAAAEMIACPDIPLRVSLQEAIRLAEWFGTDESRRFINGVLDALLHSIESERGSEQR